MGGNDRNPDSSGQGVDSVHDAGPERNWNPEDVRSWIEELERCPPGGVGDAYARDVAAFLNQYCRGRLRKEQAELFLRGQKAVVDYQRRRGS
jgi:hypothetical protein